MKKLWTCTVEFELMVVAETKEHAQKIACENFRNESVFPDIFDCRIATCIYGDWHESEPYGESEGKSCQTWLDSPGQAG